MRERGETKRRLEKELKVLGVAERAVKRITCKLQCGSSACFWFPILSWLSDPYVCCQAKRVQRPQPGQRRQTTSH